MRFSNGLLLKTLCTSVVVCWLPGFLSPLTAQQAAQPKTSQAANAPKPETDTARKSQTAELELPDSPGATVAELQNQDTESAQSGSTSNTPVPPAGAVQTEGSQQQQPSPQRPVGTAVAGASPASGVAASQPAGVAIAPAKQHRTRTLVLKVGAIVGAGVAIGTVVALTEATPGKPPGSH